MLSKVPLLVWFLVFLCAFAPGRGYNDCTNIFKGRIVRFEYLYWKSYWLTFDYRKIAVVRYQQRSNKIFEHDAGLSWRLHDCGFNNICLENMAHPNHWLYEKSMSSGTAYELGLEYLSDIDRDKANTNKFLIFCKDSCQDHNKCIIRPRSGGYFYSNHGLLIKTCSFCGDAPNSNWFDWDIVLLVPMERWETIDVSVCNRNIAGGIGVHFSNDQKVGISKTTSETHGISFEIETAFAKEPLPWSFTGKFTETSTWTNENLLAMEHTTSVTIRGPNGTSGIRAPLNKKVVLQQLVGYYGEQGDFQSPFFMKSMELSTHIEDC